MKSNTYTALQFMLTSILAFTCMSALIKYLQHIPSFELTFFRSIGSAAIGSYLILKQDIPILGLRQHRKFLILRGLLGFLSMILFIIVIKLIPFGTAVSLRYTSPIFAGILAVFILKERITPLQWCCFLIAFSGVLIIKGFDTRVSFLGLSLIITSAFATGCVYVVIRFLRDKEHPLVVVNYFMVIATLLSAVCMLFDWQTPKGAEWIILLSLGLFGFIGQLYMTKAYQLAAIGTIAPMKYLEAVFALLVGWIWFGETYTFLSFLGIALVVGGMLLNVYAQRK